MTTVPAHAEKVYMINSTEGWLSARISDIPNWRDDDDPIIKALKLENYHLRRRHEELRRKGDELVAQRNQLEAELHNVARQ
jgi:hypothetical protein